MFGVWRMKQPNVRAWPHATCFPVHCSYCVVYHILSLSEIQMDKLLAYRRQQKKKLFRIAVQAIPAFRLAKVRSTQPQLWPWAATFLFRIFWMIAFTLHAQKAQYRSLYYFANSPLESLAYPPPLLVSKCIIVIFSFYHLIHKNRNYAISKPFTRHKICHPSMQQHNGLVNGNGAINDDTRHQPRRHSPISARELGTTYTRLMQIIKFVACIQQIDAPNEPAYCIVTLYLNLPLHCLPSSLLSHAVRRERAPPTTNFVLNRVFTPS